MAKKSSTTQSDPATLAFSAVEDALKDSVFAGLDQPETPAAAAPPAPAAPAAAQEKQGPVRPIPRGGDSARSERQRAADKFAAQTGSVANDDRLNGSRILYDLQSKSSSAPTLVATLAAAGWILAIIIVGLVRHGRDLSSPGG